MDIPELWGWTKLLPFLRPFILGMPPPWGFIIHITNEHHLHWILVVVDNILYLICEEFYHLTSNGRYALTCVWSVWTKHTGPLESWSGASACINNIFNMPIICNCMLCFFLGNSMDEYFGHILWMNFMLDSISYSYFFNP